MGGSAFVFPGQGSQRVGMGREYLDLYSAAREFFDRAEAALDLPLTRLCLEGPEEALTRTEIAQPALFTVSAIAFRLLAEQGRVPRVVAGHSLGEYSALAAAGVMEFEEGLRAVRRRGELMAEIGDRVPGGMAAILGLAAEEVAAVCREAEAAGPVEVANYNSPEQTVVSGTLAGVETAMRLARERGARRALRLNVAAPFHSRLMLPLAEEMARVVAAIPMRAPQIPVIANVTADYVRDPEAIREALTLQIAGSVRWTETVLRLVADGVDRVVEVGPGRVLTGLVSRIAPQLPAADTAEALQACSLNAARHDPPAAR